MKRVSSILQPSAGATLASDPGSLETPFQARTAPSPWVCSMAERTAPAPSRTPLVRSAAEVSYATDRLARLDERRLGGPLGTSSGCVPTAGTVARGAGGLGVGATCFDLNNIRYITATHIGEWARNEVARYALLTRGGGPHLWDFGSAAKHHRLNCPWMPPGEHPCRDGRAARSGGTGRRPVPAAAREIRDILKAEGVVDMPLGVDIVEPPMLAALNADGHHVRDGQQVMLDAREVKSIDEIMLLNTACSMVDGAYQMISERLKPGVRESELVAERRQVAVRPRLGRRRIINAVSGERCSPHPHIFSGPLIRPGDQAFFDIISAFIGYSTCYYRTFDVGKADRNQRDAYKQAREWIDASIELMRPGVTTDQVASVSPKAEEFGFDNEMECFGLQFGHSVGLFLHERPIISRLNSLEHPVELKEGMVIALETYCPAKDGISAARIEEEVVVTADGPQVITRFPSDELFVANAY